MSSVEDDHASLALLYDSYNNNNINVNNNDGRNDVGSILSVDDNVLAALPIDPNEYLTMLNSNGMYTGNEWFYGENGEVALRNMAIEARTNAQANISGVTQLVGQPFYGQPHDIMTHTGAGVVQDFTGTAQGGNVGDFQLARMVREGGGGDGGGGGAGVLGSNMQLTAQNLLYNTQASFEESAQDMELSSAERSRNKDTRERALDRRRTSFVSDGVALGTAPKYVEFTHPWDPRIVILNPETAKIFNSLKDCDTAKRSTQEKSDDNGDGADEENAEEEASSNKRATKASGIENRTGFEEMTHIFILGPEETSMDSNVGCYLQMVQYRDGDTIKMRSARTGTRLMNTRVYYSAFPEKIGAEELDAIVRRLVIIRTANRAERRNKNTTLADSDNSESGGGGSQKKARGTLKSGVRKPGKKKASSAIVANVVKALELERIRNDAVDLRAVELGNRIPNMPRWGIHCDMTASHFLLMKHLYNVDNLPSTKRRKITKTYRAGKTSSSGRSARRSKKSSNRIVQEDSASSEENVPVFDEEPLTAIAMDGGTNRGMEEIAGSQETGAHLPRLPGSAVSQHPPFTAIPVASNRRDAVRAGSATPAHAMTNTGSDHSVAQGDSTYVQARNNGVMPKNRMTPVIDARSVLHTAAEVRTFHRDLVQFKLDAVKNHFESSCVNLSAAAPMDTGSIPHLGELRRGQDGSNIYHASSSGFVTDLIDIWRSMVNSLDEIKISFRVDPATLKKSAPGKGASGSENNLAHVSGGDDAGSKSSHALTSSDIPSGDSSKCVAEETEAAIEEKEVDMDIIPSSFTYGEEEEEEREKGDDEDLNGQNSGNAENGGGGGKFDQENTDAEISALNSEEISESKEAQKEDDVLSSANGCDLEEEEEKSDSGVSSSSKADHAKLPPTSLSESSQQTRKEMDEDKVVIEQNESESSVVQDAKLEAQEKVESETELGDEFADMSSDEINEYLFGESPKKKRETGKEDGTIIENTKKVINDNSRAEGISSKDEEDSSSAIKQNKSKKKKNNKSDNTGEEGDTGDGKLRSKSKKKTARNSKKKKTKKAATGSNNGGNKKKKGKKSNTETTNVLEEEEEETTTHKSNEKTETVVIASTIVTPTTAEEKTSNGEKTTKQNRTRTKKIAKSKRKDSNEEKKNKKNKKNNNKSKSKKKGENKKKNKSSKKEPKEVEENVHDQVENGVVSNQNDENQECADKIMEETSSTNLGIDSTSTPTIASEKENSNADSCSTSTEKVSTLSATDENESSKRARDPSLAPINQVSNATSMTSTKETDHSTDVSEKSKLERMAAIRDEITRSLSRAIQSAPSSSSKGKTRDESLRANMNEPQINAKPSSSTSVSSSNKKKKAVPSSKSSPRVAPEREEKVEDEAKTAAAVTIDVSNDDESNVIITEEKESKVLSPVALQKHSSKKRKTRDFESNAKQPVKAKKTKIESNERNDIPEIVDPHLEDGSSFASETLSPLKKEITVSSGDGDDSKLGSKKTKASASLKRKREEPITTISDSSHSMSGKRKEEEEEEEEITMEKDIKATTAKKQRTLNENHDRDAVAKVPLKLASDLSNDLMKLLLMKRASANTGTVLSENENARKETPLQTHVDADPEQEQEQPVKKTLRDWVRRKYSENADLEKLIEDRLKFVQKDVMHFTPRQLLCNDTTKRITPAQRCYFSLFHHEMCVYFPEMKDVKGFDQFSEKARASSILRSRSHASFLRAFCTKYDSMAEAVHMAYLILLYGRLDVAGKKVLPAEDRTSEDCLKNEALFETLFQDSSRDPDLYINQLFPESELQCKNILTVRCLLFMKQTREYLSSLVTPAHTAKKTTRR